MRRWTGKADLLCTDPDTAIKCNFAGSAFVKIARPRGLYDVYSIMHYHSGMLANNECEMTRTIDNCPLTKYRIPGDPTQPEEINWTKSKVSFQNFLWVRTKSPYIKPPGTPEPLESAPEPPQPAVHARRQSE
jgi:hypothetical protein